LTAIVYEIFLILLVIVIGFLAALLSSPWIQNEYLMAVLTLLFSGESKAFAVASLGLYCAAYILPLLILWIIYAGFAGSEKLKIFFVQFVSQIKILTSAVFLSAGIGIIYFALQYNQVYQTL
jgi:hypothetical protein